MRKPSKKTVSIKVLHYYNHPVLYAFMSQFLFEILEDAFLHGENEVEVPTREYRRMIDSYFDTLKN